MTIDVVIDFKLDDTEIIGRIVDRRVCESCAATYNVSFLPPKVAGTCDKCGGKLIQRPDDRKEVVVTRLETYRAQTAPLIEYYSQRGLLSTVDTARHADDVQVEVARLVEAAGPN